MHLTKVDVARQQLVTAIRLFFAREDAVSIYSLASNAWEVIDELCRLATVESESLRTRSHIDRSKDLKRDYINSPYRNFFKHADRDPDAVLSGFTERSPEAVLFLACEDYIRLNRASPVEVQVFQFWFIAMYPEKLSEGSSADLAESIALAETFRRTGRVFQGGMQRRNLPHFAFACELARTGKLGKLTKVFAHPAGMQAVSSGWLPPEPEPAPSRRSALARCPPSKVRNSLRRSRCPCRAGA